MKEKECLDAYQSGRRDFSYIYLRGYALQGVNLRGSEILYKVIWE